ncbi:MAG: peptide chain release factor 1 [Clostridia bacterium]|nr:peptide chain release factor 1 [Clostridia bacterium]MBQ7076076.1 peptide chain release factor 1 [Clostridia bacterium]MBQ9997480.1 peptide chain release factor 1 [Clostridia bacterium]
MFDKLSFLQQRYEELSAQISDPEVIADQNKFRELCKEHSDITPIVEKYNMYKSAKNQLEESKEMLGENLDKDFKELVQAEYDDAKEKIAQYEEELKILLLPKDPNDEKSVIVEIRGGAGGDEAALFASDLFRMYSMYAETKNWKIEVLSLNQTELGGIKEISFGIDGNGAYSKLKYESGVHRVQRIPSTESGGRIHTSTVTVAVLPEVEEVEVEINPNDLKIDVFRAGGPGGQCVNTTDSAVRITHLPTGLVVSCQDEKSQLKNKEKGMKILRSRLYDLLQSQQHDEIAEQRKSQVGTGDRSERIRTYNFPQGRVSDHRIGLTLHRLDSVLNGDLDEIIDALITYYQAEKLKGEE